MILYKSYEFGKVLKIVFKRCNFMEMINYPICIVEWLK